MSKRILILSTGPRKGGNSELMAKEFSRGAKDAGHDVELVSLHDKSIGFCRGCLACQKSGYCVIRDNMDAILQSMLSAEVLVFATPIYFYEMCGQMKTLLDRTNPLFAADYAFRDVYLLTAAADADIHAIDGAKAGLQGWLDCFEGARLTGSLCGAGVTNIGDVRRRSDILASAYELGKSV